MSRSGSAKWWSCSGSCDASEAPGYERLLVGGRVVQRQIARLLGAPHVGEHRLLGAGTGERREELGVPDVESFLEAQRAADVGGTLDRGDGELQSLREAGGERERVVDQLAGRDDLVDIADLRRVFGSEATAVEHRLESAVG